jgi:hypothetical protein
MTSRLHLQFECIRDYVQSFQVNISTYLCLQTQQSLVIIPKMRFLRGPPCHGLVMRMLGRVVEDFKAGRVECISDLSTYKQLSR